MTTIYLIRHAEAEGNVFRRNHGHYDSLLTPAGLRQRDALAERFADIPIDACFSSDLTRACMTAQAICRPHDLPLHRCPEFREVHFGIWEDHPFGHIERLDANAMELFRRNPSQMVLEGGETYAEYTARFLGKLTALAREYEGKTIAIFSHGAILRGVQMCLFGSDPNDPLPVADNTAVSRLRYDGTGFHADFLNDNSHLSPALSTFGRLGAILGPEMRQCNFWFAPAGDDTAMLLSLYRETWLRLYGSEERLQLSAIEAFASMTKPDYCLNAYLGDECIGSLLLRRGGHIVFLGLTERLRGHELGAQLLGQAVSRFRAEGCEAITLAVSHRNDAALRFYRKYGFRETGHVPGATEPLVQMSLRITTKDADVPPLAQ